MGGASRDTTRPPRRHGARAFLVAAAVLLLAFPSPAGQVPTVRLSTPFRVTVTGNPAPPRTLRLAIETAAHLAFPQLEDAEITLLSTDPLLEALGPRRAVTVRARLGVTTPEGTPLVWTVPVRLVNTSLPWREAAELFVSDSPETVEREGILHRGAVESARAARILYHHQNGAGRSMWLLLVLSNPTPVPARLWVTGATGGPSLDELVAGHGAARAFLEQYWVRSGVVLTVPPNGIVPLMAARVPPAHVASGIAQIALLSGARIEWELAAQFPRKGEPPIPSRVLPLDTQHQRGVFGPPQVAHTLAYAAFGPVAEMWVGADPDLLRDRATGALLQGNYGVIYSFEVHVSNPTPRTFTAALVLHANGGQAGATVLVNGVRLDVPRATPDAPYTLVKVPVPADGARDLRISTMSEAGSNYPVLLTLGPPS